MFAPTNPDGKINLQATIASATSTVGWEIVTPHHPIVCNAGELFYDEDGVLSCEHVKPEKGDGRTQQAVNHSVAMLLFELASKL